MIEGNTAEDGKDIIDRFMHVALPVRQKKKTIIVWAKGIIEDKWGEQQYSTLWAISPLLQCCSATVTYSRRFPFVMQGFECVLTLWSFRLRIIVLGIVSILVSVQQNPGRSWAPHQGELSLILPGELIDLCTSETPSGSQWTHAPRWIVRR
jgi:hypothetical protein